MQPSQIQVSLTTTLSGHTAGIYSLSQQNKSEKFFSGDGNGLIASWELDGGTDGNGIAKVKGNLFSLLHLPESSVLLAGAMNGSIYQINVEMAAETAAISMNGHAVYDMCLLDGLVFVGCGNGYLHSLEPISLELLSSTQISERHFRKLLPFSDVLLAGSSDNNIYCITPDTWEIQEILHGHTGSVFSLAYNPYTGHLLSGAMDAQLRIWDNQFNPMATLDAHLFTINDIAVHPSLPLIATASRDKTIKIWDAEEYTLLKVLTKDKYNAHSHSVNKIFWSDVTGHLISCSDDRTIKVWEIFINP